ncbi:MAG TPA: hypothetical protein VF146_02130 [Bryobacteraceae bacterium]
MAQPQTGFVSPPRTSGVVPPNPGDFEHPLSFRFTVSWGSLTGAPDPAKVLTQPIALVQSSERSRAMAPGPLVMPGPQPVVSEPQIAIAARAPDPTPSLPRPAGAMPGIQWEMVVPKMVRSTPKRASSQPAPVPATPTMTATRVTPLEPPPPNLYTSSSTFLRSFGLKVCVGFAVVAAASVPFWWKHATQPAGAEAVTSINGGDWQREAAVSGDPGVKQFRQLVVYRPSLKSTDARLEFDWTVHAGNAGIVFRAKDLGNYYAVRLKVLKSGSMPTLAAEYFSVYHFVESPHSEKVLVFSRNDPVLHVRMDIFGPMFTLYLQGSATAYWNDAKLTRGALGFLEEWHKATEVQGVRMSFPGSSQSRLLPHSQNNPAFVALQEPGSVPERATRIGGV